MPFLSSKQRTYLEVLSKLTYCNPFLPDRTEVEQELLGTSNRAIPTVWSYQSDSEGFWDNAIQISEQVRPLADELREKLRNGESADPQELRLYEDLVLYLLYDRYRGKLNELLVEFSKNCNHQDCQAAYQDFLSEFQSFVEVLPKDYKVDLLDRPAHIWAVYFQIRRVFHHVFYCIVGSSVAAARLRSSIWQSVLTHNLHRYVRSIYQNMGDISVLITGPSGTGKELVARAIALSQYVPFDANKGQFTFDYSSSFLAVHLAALSPTLIESELFGHRKGAFTGAAEDRKGLFEMCSRGGTVFLDEIGELDSEIQVKLLRVLQNRTFQRLGDLKTLDFNGKVITATNRDFAVEMREGNFREDLYYRLCADIVQTPSLREQLADQPDDLNHLVTFIAKTLTCEDYESLADEATKWIKENLSDQYHWPGNVRELEQCLRNIMIRGKYRPANTPKTNVRQEMADEFISGSLTAEQLLERYCTMIYYQTGSYEESARRLKIDRRTVKSKINTELLERLQSI